MSLLIFKNISREGPGILQIILEENNVPYDIIDLESAEDLPDPVGYDAVVVLGGPDSANDASSKMRAELEMARKAIDAGIPYLGICLGMQVLVRACGGSVHASEIREIGLRSKDGNYYSIDIEHDHVDDPLFADLQSPMGIFHLHGETVELTEKMLLIGTGKQCTHQIVKIGPNAYGIQGHFELTPEMLDMWLDNDPELLLMDRETIRKDFELLSSEYSDNGRKLFNNFLRIARII
jgi:GMP synthase-like glutamine amidotransferase